MEERRSCPSIYSGFKAVTRSVIPATLAPLPSRSHQSQPRGSTFEDGARLGRGVFPPGGWQVGPFDVCMGSRGVGVGFALFVGHGIHVLPSWRRLVGQCCVSSPTGHVFSPYCWTSLHGSIFPSACGLYIYFITILARIIQSFFILEYNWRSKTPLNGHQQSVSKVQEIWSVKIPEYLW